MIKKNIRSSCLTYELKNRTSSFWLKSPWMCTTLRLILLTYSKKELRRQWEIYFFIKQAIMVVRNANMASRDARMIRVKPPCWTVKHAVRQDVVVWRATLWPNSIWFFLTHKYKKLNKYSGFFFLRGWYFSFHWND